MGRRQTTAQRDQRMVKARAARAADQMRKVMQRKPKTIDEEDLVDAPRGYVFVGTGGATVCLTEIAGKSTLCGASARGPGLRYAPRRTGEAKVHGQCRRAWEGRERYGHPAGVEEKAQAFEEAIAQRVADAAATGG